ncbi:MAG: divalent-cation tolerance protein CutA [Nitrospirae bacterium]|nr:divalent-cation tolerance protein CutA [Nitrospirota bacterium]
MSTADGSNETIVVLVTAPPGELARAIARRLVDARLAACVNIVTSVESIYRWEGQRCEEAEWLLVIKTRRPLFDRVASEVKALHNYAIPEIIALPIVSGSKDYLRWVVESTPLTSPIL